MLRFLFVLFLFFYVIFKALIPVVWTGSFYPEGDIYREIREGPFKTQEACDAWARSLAKNDTDEWECGKNCKPYGIGLLCEDAE